MIKLRRRNRYRPRQIRFRIYYVAKYNVAQQYGGPEEGGWWFDSGVPENFRPMNGFVWKYAIPIPFFEELSYKLCRYLNGKERKRAKSEEKYGYTSVLSYQSTHYDYNHSDSFKPKPYPNERPHYE